MSPLLFVLLLTVRVYGFEYPKLLKIQNNPIAKVVENVEESLRFFWDEPVALVVEDTKEVTRDASLVVSELLCRRNVNPDLWLIKYNKTGNEISKK